MHVAKDMTGLRFGRLLVGGRAGTDHNGPRHFATWHVVCDCGAEKVVRGADMRSGRTIGCGCVRLERTTIHGQARKHGKPTSEWTAWNNIIQRCENPKAGKFKYYGGRGIKVCEQWRTSAATFLSDMGPKPSPEHSIDRYPNNDGNYEPGNCRWATRQEQAHNQRPRSRSCLPAPS